MRMQNIVRTSLLALLICGIAFAKPSAQSPTEKRTAPLKSFDVSIIDRSVDPCTRLLPVRVRRLAQEQPDPSDKARWGRFDELRECNLWTLRDILERGVEAVAVAHALEAQVGDFYASCMDEAAIEAAGARSRSPDLARDRARRRRRSSST